MRSGRLSAEFVDGSAALRFGEVFDCGNIELGFDLIGGDSVLSGEIEEILDLFGRCGSSFVSESTRNVSIGAYLSQRPHFISI